MARKKKNPNKVVAYAYVGRYCDDTLGWQIPICLSPYDTLKRPRQPNANENTAGHWFELCKVTIQVVKGRRKRKAKAQ